MYNKGGPLPQESLNEWRARLKTLTPREGSLGQDQESEVTKDILQTPALTTRYEGGVTSATATESFEDTSLAVGGYQAQVALIPVLNQLTKEDPAKLGEIRQLLTMRTGDLGNAQTREERLHEMDRLIKMAKQLEEVVVSAFADDTCPIPAPK